MLGLCKDYVRTWVREFERKVKENREEIEGKRDKYYGSGRLLGKFGSRD